MPCCSIFDGQHTVPQALPLGLRKFQDSIRRSVQDLAGIGADRINCRVEFIRLDDELTGFRQPVPFFGVTSHGRLTVVADVGHNLGGRLICRLIERFDLSHHFPKVVSGQLPKIYLVSHVASPLSYGDLVHDRPSPSTHRQRSTEPM